MSKKTKAEKWIPTKEEIKEMEKAETFPNYVTKNLRRKNSYHKVKIEVSELLQKIQPLIGNDVVLEYIGDVAFSNHYEQFCCSIIDNELIVHDKRTHDVISTIEDFTLNLKKVNKIWLDTSWDHTFFFELWSGGTLRIGNSCKQVEKIIDELDELPF